MKAQQFYIDLRPHQQRFKSPTENSEIQGFFKIQYFLRQSNFQGLF